MNFFSFDESDKKIFFSQLSLVLKDDNEFIRFYGMRYLISYLDSLRNMKWTFENEEQEKMMIEFMGEFQKYTLKYELIVPVHERQKEIKTYIRCLLFLQDLQKNQLKEWIAPETELDFEIQNAFHFDEIDPPLKWFVNIQLNFVSLMHSLNNSLFFKSEEEFEDFKKSTKLYDYRLQIMKMIYYMIGIKEQYELLDYSKKNYDKIKDSNMYNFAKNPFPDFKNICLMFLKNIEYCVDSKKIDESLLSELIPIKLGIFISTKILNECCLNDSDSDTRKFWITLNATNILSCIL